MSQKNAKFMTPSEINFFIPLEYKRFQKKILNTRKKLYKSTEALSRYFPSLQCNMKMNGMQKKI